MLTIADLARAPERVFPTHARVERYYPAPAAEEARTVLGRCLDRGEGPVLLIGSPGTGKSMLLEVLADDLGAHRPVVCLTSAQLCTRRALLQSILFELGQSYRQRDEGDLRLSLMDYLTQGDVAKSGMLLLVDEAQSLPIRLLEELRVLGNVAHQGVPIVRLLLAGSGPLEETFTEPEVEAFNQRIAARCYLAPLSHQDTAQFVRGHLAAAGASPDELFTTDALDAVYRATDGITRLVNQLCDRTLVLAAAHGAGQVTKDLVQGAWADLQQLPTPWNLPDTPELPEATISDSHDDAEIVEFGPLSDDHSHETVESREHPLAQSDTSPGARIHMPDSEDDASLDTVEFAEWPSSDGTTDELLSSETAFNAFEGEVPEPEIAEIEIAVPEIAEPEGAESLPMTVQSIVTPVAESTTPDSSPTAEPLADLFGDDDFEEEVVIDEFSSFEQTIPPTRPRVTSACDAELSQLLHEVMITNGVSPVSTSSIPAELSADLEADEDTLPELSLPSFSIVNEELHEADDIAPEGTELDDESNELLDEINAIAVEAQQASEAVEQGELAPNAWQGDELDVLVIDDEMALPLHTAAAQRADYRQLFKTLRDN